jgi:hypothetical protein
MAGPVSNIIYIIISIIMYLCIYIHKSIKLIILAI